MLSVTGSGNPLHAQGANYGYDGLHRLTSATYPSGAETFHYDRLGNRDGDGTGGQYGYTDTQAGGANVRTATTTRPTSMPGPTASR